jgi:predicted ATP-dependent endonuclease of OLD family
MHISKLSIRNYRNFRSISLSLNKGINTIIGENGSGKTNLLNAIRLLVDNSLPRSLRFYEIDFNRSISSWRGHWIILQIEFDDLDLGDEFQALVVHRTGEIEEDSKKGSYSLFFRPKKEIREKLYQYSCVDDKEQNGLNEILNQISIFDYEIVFNGRTSVDFSDDSIYNDYVGNFNEISFPNPEEL